MYFTGFLAVDFVAVLATQAKVAWYPPTGEAKTPMGRQRDCQYRMWQDGAIVAVQCNVPEEFLPVKAYDPLGSERIFSVDTEVLRHHGKEKTVLVLMGFHDGEQAIDTRATGSGMAVEMCRKILERFGEDLPHESQIKRREKREGRSGRDGRRTTIRPCVAVWFNLEFDLGRILCDQREHLKSVFAGADSYRIPVSARFEIEIIRLVLGSGSHFEWYIRDKKQKKIARVIGLDLTGYWKCNLAKAAKATSVTDKIDIDPIFYDRPLERFSTEEWNEFLEYGLGDVKTTRELYLATSRLLQQIDARVLRRDGIIPPSAPGASARIMFARAFDLHPTRTSWRRPPVWAEQLACDAYFAGRCFCTQPGLHKNLISLDLKSAYPHIMALLPDPVTVQFELCKPGPLSLDTRNLRGAFGVLVVDGESLDPIYPAIRTRDTKKNRIRYVYGPFARLAITIPEIVLGVLSGSLRIDRVHEGFVMRGGSPDTSFIRNTIVTEFTIKEDSRSEEALSTMAKLLMNAGYGKWVEVHASEGWIPPVPIPDFVMSETIAKSIGKLVAEHGPPSSRLIDRGIYWGPPVPKLQRRARDFYDRNGPRPGTPLEERASLAVHAYGQALEAIGVPVRKGPYVSAEEYVRRERSYHAGHYFLPSFAAQVTGLTSARLCLMAQTMGAIQGDTDSVHFAVPEGAVRLEDRKLMLDESSIPQIERYYHIMREAGYPSPRKRADGSVEDGIPGAELLGVWAVETPPSEESVCARSKVYSHKFTDLGTGKITYKGAHHAFAKYESLESAIIRRNGNLPREEREKLAAAKVKESLHRDLKKFVTLREVTYMTRLAPRRLRAALVQNLEPGAFTTEERIVMLKPDPNTWDDTGTVKWNELEEGSRGYVGKQSA
jgi:DNA polymerase type B, organellar and viral